MARRDGRRGVGELLKDLGDGGSRLLRHELRLARLEVQDVARGVAVGSGLTITGAVLALVGAMAVLTGVILLLGDAWLRDRYWLAALIVTAALGAIAAWAAWRGKTLLQPERLEPDETVATLREDREWLKRQLTSAGTSS
ncbi:MAG TPA: phage holin family protein [Gemmatimonadaceae bacterium]|nr:phage holin family protein [Gemmatimonadaceae bacterium]